MWNRLSVCVFPLLLAPRTLWPLSGCVCVGFVTTLRLSLSLSLYNLNAINSHSLPVDNIFRLSTMLVLVCSVGTSQNEVKNILCRERHTGCPLTAWEWRWVRMFCTHRIMWWSEWGHLSLCQSYQIVLTLCVCALHILTLYTLQFGDANVYFICPPIL